MADKQVKHYEVEAKYPISADEFKSLLPEKLRAGKFISRGAQLQHDYFLPVSRPTDNCRIRYETVGGITTVNYTEKRAVTANGVATREEKESVISGDEAVAIIEQSGYVPSYYKWRYEYAGEYHGYPCKVCLDTVEDTQPQLYFLEIEFLSSDPVTVPVMNQLIEKFAAELLGERREQEPRSHRAMLFQRLGLV